MNQNVRGILVIAQMEFLQALWSLRSIAFGGLFFLFVAAGAYFSVGAFLGQGNIAPQAGAPGLGFLVLFGIIGLTAFFGPLIAIFSSVDAIVAERNARTMDMLLSKPVTRRGLALGKLIGRAAHVAIIAYVSIAAGLLIVASQAAPPLVESLLFCLLVALLVTVWVAIGMLLSSITRTPSSAIVAGVVVWLTFYIFWGFLQEGFNRINLGGLAPLLNPNTLFLGAVSQLIPTAGLALATLTKGLNTDFAVPALVVFLFVAVFVAVEVFGRQDEAAGS